jgi:hypothetical protein
VGSGKVQYRSPVCFIAYLKNPLKAEIRVVDLGNEGIGRIHQGIKYDHRCICNSMGYFFEVGSFSKTRGHTLKLKKNRCKPDAQKCFFRERVINRWN